MNKIKVSKFLTYVLRHRPDSIGVQLDKAGWVSITELLEKSETEFNGKLTRNLLDEIVTEDTKQRYAISPDGLRIRANQGHSVAVELELKEAIPPVTLYHGTHTGATDIIFKQGLQKMKRHHVHLSDCPQKAKEIGARRGKPVVLTVDTREMVRSGVKFYISQNGVWLTDFVEPKFLTFSTT